MMSITGCNRQRKDSRSCMLSDIEELNGEYTWHD